MAVLCIAVSYELVCYIPEDNHLTAVRTPDHTNGSALLKTNICAEHRACHAELNEFKMFKHYGEYFSV
jgi:hypothetical protein